MSCNLGVVAMCRQWAQLRRVLDRRRQINPSTSDAPTTGKRGRRLPLTYIIKPQAASQGRGISVVQSLDHLTSTDTCIVQVRTMTIFLCLICLVPWQGVD